MKKGTSALTAIQTTQKTNSRMKKLLKLIIPSVISIILALSLVSCDTKKTDYDIMKEWQVNYNKEITEYLLSNMDYKIEEKPELVKACNINNKTCLTMSLDYNDDYIIIETPLDGKYTSLLDAAKNDAEIEKISCSIIDKEDCKPSQDLLDFIELSFGNEAKKQFSQLKSPEDGFCLINQHEKCFEYYLTKENKVYYKIQLKDSIPDEYFGDFKHMNEYILDTSKLSGNDYYNQLKKENIIATNEDWNLEKYK